MESTPRLTRHAAQRCAEMGISTKVAKAIVRRADIIRPARSDSGASLAVCDEPELRDYAVVYVHDGDGVPLVLTVVFRTYETYVRRGTEYDPIVDWDPFASPA